MDETNVFFNDDQKAVLLKSLNDLNFSSGPLSDLIIVLVWKQETS